MNSRRAWATYCQPISKGEEGSECSSVVTCLLSTFGAMGSVLRTENTEIEMESVWDARFSPVDCGQSPVRELWHGLDIACVKIGGPLWFPVESSTCPSVRLSIRGTVGGV